MQFHGIFVHKIKLFNLNLDNNFIIIFSGKKGRPKKSRNKNNKTDQSDVSPSTSCGSPTIPDFDELTKEVDGSEVNPFSELEFSFERTPHREGWYQTYSRQDLGDEILYYSDHQYFPLPYEMPMNTFYPWRAGDKPGGKKSLKNTPEASGSATPIIDQDEDSMPTPMRTTRNKSIKKNLNEASFFDKIDPKKAKALQAADIFARKSPRGHASTKSLLMNTNSPYVDDDEAFEHILYHGISHVDECSNDSVMSNISSRKAGSGAKCESIGQLIEIANCLDAFFCEEDPLLMDNSSTISTSEQNQNQKKRSRRRSSSGQQQQSGGSRSKRRSKDQISNDNANNVNGVDRIVDTNVDPVFLDCLEDELPSVTFDDPNRSINDPMEWIGTYDQCTSINLFSNNKGVGKKKFSARGGGGNGSPNAAAIEKGRDSSLENDDLPVDPKCQPTILRRLLTSPDSDNNKKDDEEENININNKRTGSGNERPLIKPKLVTDYSSSECASVSESVASSSSTRRRKKRNMTGFPSPKKKNKNIIAPSLNPKSRKAKENTSSGEMQISPKASRSKSKQTAASANNSKSSAKSSVQMQLKLTKNGTISLQKPMNKHSQSLKNNSVSGKQRGRPLSKSKLQSPPTTSRSRSTTTATATSKTNNSSTKSSKPSKGPSIKYPKIDKSKHDIIEIPSSTENEEDESDFDDVDDKSFHPNGSTRNKTKGPGRRRKKKKRKLTMPVKRKFVLVKPKVITIDDDDNDSEITTTNHNNKNDNEFSTEESSDSENNQNDERSEDDDSEEGGISISRKKEGGGTGNNAEAASEDQDDEEASDEGSDDDDDDEDEEDIPISRQQAAKKNKGNKPLRPRVIRKRKQS